MGAALRQRVDEPTTKKIDRLVIGEGGVLGIGSRRVALPLDAFAWNHDKSGFRVTKTADDLKSMPEWRQEQSQAPAGPSLR